MDTVADLGPWRSCRTGLSCRHWGSDSDHPWRIGTLRGGAPTGVIYRIDQTRHAVTVVGVFARADAYRSP